MALILLTPPPVEPVSLADVKQVLRMDVADTSQDENIADMIAAARSWAEAHTRRCFVAATWQLSLDFFPGYIDLKLAGSKVSSPFVSGSNAVLVGIRYALVMPYPPVNSMVYFQYQNANGEVTQMNEGTDYIADLISNPARLTPPFGAMWPVARVVVNAVQIAYALGYAMPITVTGPSGSPPDPQQILSSDYVFQATDVGRPISIVGASPNGLTLNTIITAIASPPSSTAFIRDACATGVTGANALLVNAPAGNPRHWNLIRAGIKGLAAAWCELAAPDKTKIPQRVLDCLGPVRDLR